VHTVHSGKDRLDLHCFTALGHPVEHSSDDDRLQAEEHDEPEDPDDEHEEERYPLMGKEEPVPAC